jgi:hypothetical protein
MNDKERLMITDTVRNREDERGSALILATLISVIASMALYVAEAGARLTVAWFGDPSSTGFQVPTTGQLDRAKRLLDHDDNPGTPRVLAAAGDAAKPLYKDSALTPSGPFDKPFRSALADTFYGVETGSDADPNFANAGPDLIVTSAHLATINDALFPNFPSADLRARIARIEVYAPPILNSGGADTRMGIATVRVVGGVFIYPGTADERQIATRVVKAVVNEIPVPGPGGPLQSCAALGYNGEFSVHWGTSASVGNADLPSNLDSKSNTGLPYALHDPFTYINGANTLASWATAHDGNDIEDPWFKFVAGGTIDEATNGNPQPWPHTYPGDTTSDHSNLFQNTLISCPTFDYSLWKWIAQSGNRKNYYYEHDSGTNFKLDGMGAAVSFRNATSGQAGVFFFDTTDGSPPNGLPYTDASSNLTPAVNLSGGAWGTQGFVFLNAKEFGTTGLGGVNRTVIPPGEPGDGSGFVNLDYPSTLTGTYTVRDGAVNFETFQDPVTGEWHCTDAQQCDGAARIPAGSPVQDDYGIPFVASMAMDGVLYISGVFNIQGNANYFGSVIGQQGVIDSAGSPNFFFDESLIKGNWPRKGMDVPRVIVTAWETDL